MSNLEVCFICHEISMAAAKNIKILVAGCVSLNQLDQFLFFPNLKRSFPLYISFIMVMQLVKK